VDGVLTDGRLVYGSRGEELKTFDVKDGMAFGLLRRAGLEFGLLSGRKSGALKARAGELGVSFLRMDCADKATAFAELLAEKGLSPEEVAYAGDDLPDLPVILACGLSFAPADAVAEVRARAHCVLSAAGGRGAVRELAEVLLKARGQWDELVAAYVPGEPA
jgi:3-deoxy-D-manno-octulosonate 8-phosphate phosphatase (KDO 8-P phosphatase)